MKAPKANTKKNFSRLNTDKRKQTESEIDLIRLYSETWKTANSKAIAEVEKL